jgi:cell division protein ZapA (FtsZ GTPase activity inhibitor)
VTRARKPRTSVTVTIAGERHTIRSDADPDYTRSVAAHLDKTVRGLGNAQPLEPHRTAILAALVITDELFRVRSELEGLREQLTRRAGRLVDELEAAVQHLPLTPRASCSDDAADAPEAKPPSA